MRQLRATIPCHLGRLSFLGALAFTGIQLNTRDGAQEITPSLPLGALPGATTPPEATLLGTTQEPIKVILDDNLVNFLDVSPIEVGGRILVPLREVFEALGATVNYDATSRTIAATRDSTQIKLQLDSTAATVDGRSRLLDVPAQARAGHTLVPLRFVSEALGAQVNWNAAQRTVALIAAPLTAASKPAAPPPERVSAGASPGALTPYLVPVQTISAPTTTTVEGTVRRVEVGPPATIVISVNNQDATYSLADNASLTRQTTGMLALGTQPVYSAPSNIALARLVPGEEVSLGLNVNQQVTRIAARASVITARVRSAGGTQISLEDRWNTTLSIGPLLRYLDAQRRPAPTVEVRPGASVALFIAPTTRSIYQVSASSLDMAAPPPYTPPTSPNPNLPPHAIPPVAPPGTLPPRSTPPVTPFTPPLVLPPHDAPPGTAQIQLVTHNAPRPIRRGATIRVTVRGTPGLRGTFDAAPRATGLTLIEDPVRPGVYTGTHTVETGDDVLNGHITAHLSSANGQSATLQSRAPLTIDTVPPRIINTFPADRALINNAQPNIAVQADDIGGSGLAKATMSITDDGQTFDVPVTVAPPGIVTAIPTRPLTGLATIRVNIADAASNSAGVTFSITVNGAAGAITAFTHNAARALQAGEDVVVNMLAPTGGKATLDVMDNTNQPLAHDIPMRETTAGHYRGTYRIQDTTDAARLRLVGRYTDANNRISSSEATTPLLILDNTPPVLAILQPGATEHATSPLVVRGRAAPGATVDVAVHIAGARLAIFEYNQDLPTQQVQANANGNWQTAPLELPKERGIAGLEYTISATQTDAANRHSEPVTVTLKP